MRRVNSYNIIEPFSCHVYSAYLTTDVSPCTLFSWGDMYVYVFRSTLWLCATHVYSRSVYSDVCICFVLILPLSVLLLIKDILHKFDRGMHTCMAVHTSHS